MHGARQMSMMEDRMDTPHDEFSSFEARLTLARWHLDAAACAQDAAMRDHLARARQTCEVLSLALTGLAAADAQRASIEGQLADLRSRLEEAEAAAA
jgi:hypothetical protein